MTWLDTTTPGFGVAHLPYGSFSAEPGEPRLGVRVGDSVLDLRAAAHGGLVPAICDAPNLNRLLASGPSEWAEVRGSVQQLLEDDANRPALTSLLCPIAAVEMHLPMDVADYVDFYSSEQHATNVGRLFRPDSAPLLPNWKHLPVGYHGRSGTVVVSGTPIQRPAGQRREADGSISLGPSRKLDIELEMGVVLGNPTRLGEPVAIESAADHIFGVALLNDWSARDIQAWEYVPLGPFLGKSFATTVSAWVTPLEALEGLMKPGPPQDPQPLPYLLTDEPWAVDVELEVALSSAAMRDKDTAPRVIASANYQEMYWTMAQQLAHMTVNGATVRAGDLYGSGTISGSDPASYGSLLELSRNGRDRIDLGDGSDRTFLEDGDEIVISGRGGASDVALTLGDATGTIVATR